MDDKIFTEEQNHLTKVYSRLVEMKDDLTSQRRALEKRAQEEKNDIRDNLNFDFADDEVTTEAYGEIETWNRYIDGYNVSSSILSSKLEDVEKLLEGPYFARVTLRFSPEEEPEDYYIGTAQLTEDEYDPLVIDWRSPIAETYYNQENGMTSYEVEGRKIPVELLLRRQFDLDKDKLLSYFDTQVAIEDALLLQSLSARRTDKMQAITATIQKEQNAVIRHKDVPVLLVDGIAGSGKTSVLLQRIAYLFYRRRKTLRPEQVYLLTLNPVFRQYIDSVLPDLGEQNPNTLTWQEFLDDCGVPFRDREHDRTRKENLEKIDAALGTLKPEPAFFKPVMQKKRCIFTAEEIADIIGKRLKLGVDYHMTQVAVDELEELARVRLRKQAHDISDDDSQIEQDDALTPYSDAEENRMQNSGMAIKTIRDYGFLNLKAIGERILGRKSMTAAEYLYLKTALTGACDRNAKYVMVDEVQDYSMAQLMVLERYFPNAKFMLLGDEFQAIRQGTADFSQMEEFFLSRKKPVERISLFTSYRSSPEITQLFAKMLPEEKRIQISSVQRPGEMPNIRSFASEEEYKEALREEVLQARENEGLAAIICISKKSAHKVQELLGEDAPEYLNGKKGLPEKGIVVMDLALAKGMEFDTVILPDADNDRYPGGELSRHRLYTAISRATKHLSILSLGPVSSLLS